MSAEPNPSVGQTLRNRRRQKNLTVELVSHETHIHAKFLRALEEEKWDEFPARVYLQGFLRQYASYLGLDGDQLMVDYRKQVGEAEKPAFVRQPAEENAPAPGPAFPLYGKVLIAAIAGLLLIGFYLYKGQRTPPEEMERDVTAPAVRSEPSSAVPSGIHEFQVQIKDTVWMRAWVDGKLRFEGTVRTGAKSWRGSQDFRLQTGRLSALDVSVDGAPLAPVAAGAGVGEFVWPSSGTSVPAAGASRPSDADTTPLAAPAPAPRPAGIRAPAPAAPPRPVEVSTFPASGRTRIPEPQ